MSLQVSLSILQGLAVIVYGQRGLLARPIRMEPVAVRKPMYRIVAEDRLPGAMPRMPDLQLHQETEDRPSRATVVMPEPAAHRHVVDETLRLDVHLPSLPTDDTSVKPPGAVVDEEQRGEGPYASPTARAMPSIPSWLATLGIWLVLVAVPVVLYQFVVPGGLPAHSMAAAGTLGGTGVWFVAVAGRLGGKPSKKQPSPSSAVRQNDLGAGGPSGHPPAVPMSLTLPRRTFIAGGLLSLLAASTKQPPAGPAGARVPRDDDPILEAITQQLEGAVQRYYAAIRERLARGEAFDPGALLITMMGLAVLQVFEEHRATVQNSIRR